MSTPTPKPMTLVPEPIEAYAASHTEPVGPVLEALREETFSSVPRAQMQVGAIEGTFLRMLVQLVGAKRVVEVGTFTGYSALCIAQGLPEDGELVTCDVNAETTAMARRYWDQTPHGKKIRAVVAPALETLAGLEGTFDLAFIDAEKTGYDGYYEALLPKIRQGGLLVIDNTLWSGRVLDPQTGDDHAIVAFNAKVAADARVEKVLLTVRDGMTLARKR